VKISIAMTTYNGGAYLQEQLDSFLCQTVLPDELVVCDDGSSDDTYLILSEFKKKANFDVNIVLNEVNLGYIMNFEKSLSLCTGDLIFLSDQDDVWFCNKIEVMVGIMRERTDVYVMQADMILADRDMKPSVYTQLGNIIALGLGSDSFITGCGTAVRKQWLDIARPIPEGIGHDYWMHRLAVALGVRLLINVPLQYYRRHEDNVSNWFASNACKVTEFQAARISGFRDATEGWKAERSRDMLMLDRMAMCVETLKELDLLERQAKASTDIERHIGALSDRIELMRSRRIQRFPRVLAMWLQGKYRHFSGWKSAVKDILRP